MGTFLSVSKLRGQASADNICLLLDQKICQKRELLGCAISADGEIVDAAYHARLTSFIRTQPADRPTTVVASGIYRAPAIRAALKGKLANSLITDENTARLVLSMN